MRLALVTGSLLLAVAGRASAQPAVPAPGPVPGPPPASVPGGEPRSEGLATRLALGGTLLPLMLYATTLTIRDSDLRTPLYWVGAVSATFLPSVGHWYGGKIFPLGLGLRLVGAPTCAFATFLYLLSMDSAPGSRGALTVAVLGGAVFATGLIYDLSTTPRSVRRWNQKHGFAIAPVVTGSSMELAIGGRF